MAKRKSAAQKRQEEQELDNVRRELFCRYYAQGEGTFGNATLSYAAAYDYDLKFYEHIDRSGKTKASPANPATYHSCSAAGSRLLRSVEVQERIMELRQELLTDAVVDTELIKVIKQDHERGPKVLAIREFNKLRKRIDDKPQITFNALDPETQKKVDTVLESFLSHATQRDTGK